MKIGNIEISSLKVGSADCKVYLGSVQVYPNEPSYDQQYLTFVAKQNSTFKFSGNSISYSTNSGRTWTTLASNTDTPTVHSGETIMWKATIRPTNGIGRFSSSGAFDAEGNIMSLLYGDDFSDKTDFSGNTHVFKGLFYASSIENAENLELPATTLTQSCYSEMFGHCTSLVTAPVLSATTLANTCYYQMFNGCTSLVNAPELPATTLADTCYRGMFRECTSLVTAPNLMASTLVNYCYTEMFYGCTSLVTPPQLAATTLAHYCCHSMFLGCTSLTKSPELLATTLADYSYHSMFKRCTSLKRITCLATDISANFSTYDWVTNVCADGGTFLKDPSNNAWTIGSSSSVPSNWIIFDYSDKSHEEEYLSFVPYNSDTKFKFSGNSIDYSVNGGTSWTTLPSDTYTPNISTSQTIMFRASLTPTSTDGIGTFSSSGTSFWIAKGNPMSLLYGDDFKGKKSLNGKNHAFKGLFKGCTYLETANDLKLVATELSQECYANMFSGCTILNTVPTELPKTEMKRSCYLSMFLGCTNLEYVPYDYLESTTLATNCYTNMFNRCNKLKRMPELPATTLAEGCYYNMFYTNVESTATTTPTSFVLPATTLVKDCYRQMFLHRKNIDKITCLATSGIGANDSTTSWLQYVGTSGTFTKASSATWGSGISGTNGWTVVNYS